MSVARGSSGVSTPGGQFKLSLRYGGDIFGNIFGDVVGDVVTFHCSLNLTFFVSSVRVMCVMSTCVTCLTPSPPSINTPFTL